MTTTARTARIERDHAELATVVANDPEQQSGTSLDRLQTASGVAMVTRVRAALRHSGFANYGGTVELQLKSETTRNGPPPDVAFDLAVAVAIAKERGWPMVWSDTTLFLGELSLDGHVRAVRGAFAIAETAALAGVTSIVCPADSQALVRMAVPHMEVHGVATLAQAIALLSGGAVAGEPPTKSSTAFAVTEPCWSEVVGQDHAKRALEIAAAGGHGILLERTPGAGAVMLARRLTTILPDLDEAETRRIIATMDMAGLFPESVQRLGPVRRPFRAPHYSASSGGMFGTAKYLGEVDLAWDGVLMLDDVHEFETRTLENVTAAQQRKRQRGGSEPLLVATLNRCFCYAPKIDCACKATEVVARRRKLMHQLPSIHIAVDMGPVPPASKRIRGETSATVRERVAQARAMQVARYGGALSRVDSLGVPVPQTNAGASCDDLLGLADLTELAEAELHEAESDAYNQNGVQILRVARTIADLAESTRILPQHVREAASLSAARRTAADTPAPLPDSAQRQPQWCKGGHNDTDGTWSAWQPNGGASIGEAINGQDSDD